MNPSDMPREATTGLRSGGTGHKPPVEAKRDGRPVLLVPLSNSSQPAIVDRADFERLKAAGVTDRAWFLNGSHGYRYVRVAASDFAGGVATVARLILGVGEKKTVTYANGNRLDLTRRNLTTKRGGARLRADAAKAAFKRKSDPATVAAAEQVLHEYLRTRGHRSVRNIRKLLRATITMERAMKADEVEKDHDCGA
jgi:hypothetical protein